VKQALWLAHDMAINMRSGILCWFLLAWLVSSPAAAQDYAYRLPTVSRDDLGTPLELQAELPADIPASIGQVTVFPDRKVRRCSGWVIAKLSLQPAGRASAAGLHHRRHRRQSPGVEDGAPAESALPGRLPVVGLRRRPTRTSWWRPPATECRGCWPRMPPISTGPCS